MAGIRYLPLTGTVAGDDPRYDIAAPADSLNSLLEQTGSGTIIRIGDLDALAALHPQFSPAEQAQLSTIYEWTGTQAPSESLMMELRSACNAADWVGFHPRMQRETRVWGPGAMLISQGGFAGPFFDVNAIYRAISLPEFWERLKKRIIIVGAKAPLFQEYCWNNDRYRTTFPMLQFDLVGTIQTPDVPGGLAARATIWAAIQQTFGTADCYLLSCGMLAKLLAHDIQQAGYPAIDFGNCLETMMGLRNQRGRPGEIFHAYEHPEWQFVVDRLARVADVRRIKK